jgi:hypothetical protein
MLAGMSLMRVQAVVNPLLALGLVACAGKPMPMPATAPVARIAEPAPPAGPIRLIVRGDDMGALHGINLGIMEAYRNGIMRTVQVIVPGPWFPEAVKMLQEHPDIDVGVHLALTSEWSNVKWRPLTWAPSLVDEDGYFFPMIWPRDDFPPGTALRQASWKLAEVEAELRAQIELLRKHVPRLSHVGCHMGCESLAPEVAAVVAKLRREYGLDADVSSLKRLPLQWPKDRKRNELTTDQRIDVFVHALATMGPGDYEFGEHPATDDPEMRAVFHTGYENVAQDRAAVTALWTNERVKEVVRRRGVQIIGFRDLPRR